MFWGLTPALNLLEEFKNPPEVLNILIIGGADCRHVLKTLASRYKHRKVQINFFLMEACPETIAKQMLLLNIAFQPAEEMGLIQKTRIFMELYGNTLVRPAVAKYLTSSAAQLVRMITNLSYMKEVMPFINLELKYRERDYMENLFKFWCGCGDFNICECWDRRVRKHLGVRYDTRAGAFDWDLHMRFRNIGGHQVCNQEYQSFRSLGVAFTWLESEVSKPNRSMVCGIISNGENFAHYGYLGDIQTGPFVAFGLDCEDPELLKSNNNINTHRATDVTERNLKQIFHELLTGDEYVHQATSSFTLGHLPPTATVKVIDVGPTGDSVHAKTRACVPLENTSITFLSLSTLKMMKHKERYEKFFNLVYFNYSYLKHFDGEIIEKISAPDARLVVENTLFLLNNRNKEMEEFGKSISEQTDTLKHKTELHFDVQKDYYAKFILKEA